MIHKTTHKLGLGRRPAKDERDCEHLMSAVLPRRVAITTKHWPTGPILDQGSHPYCVGFGFRQLLTSSPVRYRPDQGLAPISIYREAQRVDEWPGEDYEGTSVRAGAKVCRAAGLIEGYVWAFDAKTLRDYVLYRGPVVIGVDWFDGMYSLNRKGYLEATGDIVGGHALLVSGYGHTRNAFRLTNSWSEHWGEKGKAWLDFETMDFLLKERDGEACSAIEIAPSKKVTV